MLANIPDVSTERFMQFYAPGHSDVGAEEVARRVLEVRPRKLATSMGTLSARQLVYCECRHAAIFDQDTLTPFGMSHGEREEAEGLLDRSVVDIVDSTLRAVDEVRNTEALIGKPTIATTTVALSGLVMAMRAHSGQMRQNGKEYYTHPASVAAILTSAWQSYPAITEQAITDDIYLGYTHDAFEEMMHQDGSTLLSKKVQASPHITRKLYERLGQNADDVVDAQFFLTKPIGLDGQKMIYPRYVARGKHSIRFVGVKMADMQHNLRIDPKPSYNSDLSFSNKTSLKKREYHNSQADLLRAAEEMPDTGIDQLLFLSRITAITSEDIRLLEFTGNAERIIKMIVNQS